MSTRVTRQTTLKNKIKEKLNVEINKEEILCQDKNISLLRRIELFDEQLGYDTYRYVQNHKILNKMFEYISLSGDEILWYPLAAGGGTLLFLSRGLGLVSPLGCVEELLWDLFGSLALCNTAESLLKLLLRRQRPRYAPQSAQCSVPGEQHSLPSGHALRAVYLRF